MFACRQKPFSLKHLMKQMHFLANSFNAMGFNPNAMSSSHFIHMANMRLCGEIASPRSYIFGVTANNLHEPISGISKSLQVTRLIHMAVIISPIQRHCAPHSQNRFTEIQRIASAHNLSILIKQFILVFQQSTRAPILSFQGSHHANKIIVSDTFQLPNRVHPRLFIRLVRNHIHQFVRKFRYFHKLRPRPF